MGIIASLFRPQTEQRSLSTLIDMFPRTMSGVDVSPSSALTMTAVWACVRVVSESLAGLPLITYRRRADGGKERAAEHPVYTLLHDQPNPEMTAFELREMMAAHVETWGNAYANIEWSAGGQVRGLWPLNPSKVEKLERVQGALFYAYRMPDQQLRWINATEVLHVRGLTGDGTFGYSPVKLHMEAIGLGLATERYGSAFFGNGARPGGLLMHPGKLSEQAYGRLRESFNSQHQGIENAHRLKILEEGMSYEAVGIPPEEAQFLETRKFQVTEIARIFRIPPHMIGDLDRATFSNVEQQSIDFVVHSLRPRLVRFEQAYQRQLLTPTERRTYFVEHLVDGLLRGDITSRYAAYNTAIIAGFMNRNEVRQLENMNPAEDLDAYLVPLNMIEAGQPMATPAPRSAEGYETRIDEDEIERRAQSTAGDRQSIARAQEGVLLDAMARIVRRESADIGRAVERFLVRANDVAGFLLWLDEFYSEHSSFIDRNLRSGFVALAGLVVASVNRELDGSIDADAIQEFVLDYVGAMANRWADSNAQQIRALVRDEEDQAAEAIKERLNSWEATEAEKNARRETYRAVNALAYAVYGVAGVAALRWVARGENCPYCRSLNGKIVGYNSPFVGEGDYQPDGADAPLLIRRRTKHAPLHDGCDCQVIASR